ncbi:MAG: DUF4159 domain-containing protein [Planctomycetes bacterium]|nr:DUF4159 domain-containing protein [Planctomycetota bacterium]
MNGTLIRCAILAMAAIAVAAMPVAAEVTDDDIQAAIDRGVAWLWTQQRPNGWFSDKGWFGYGDNVPEDRRTPGAHETMAMLGLTFAGVSVNDPRMLKGFDAMLEFELKHTYTIAPRAMVIARLLKKLDRERREKAWKILKQDVKWLQEAQNGVGAWGYDYEARLHDTYGWDFSNTQMAVLGLSEAEMAGVEIDPKVMLKVQNLYLDRQRDDGGWNYGMRPGFQADDHPDGAKEGSYGSMTAAAVATLFITRDFLYRGIGCPCKSQQSGKTPRELKRIDQAIDRGVDWLAKHFDVKINPLGSRFHWKLYWLYSCERVGLAAGLKYFGTHDWYREGAAEVVGMQQRDGDWENTVWSTSYALCFLAKGRAPILANKLKFKGEWHNHPRDLYNLAHYVGGQKEQLINWQIINTQVPVHEWHDSPLLYISAETQPEFTDEELQKLRQFTDTGGTILFEASCGNRSIATWWKTTVEKLWPEWEMKLLDRDHPMWTADAQIKRPPAMFGLSDGMRTFIFFSPMDISCPWNTMAIAKQRELFDVGTNLYIYSTDHRPLRSRLAGSRPARRKEYAEASLSAGSKTNLTLARLKHGGDWYIGRHYKAPALLARSLGNAGSGMSNDPLEVAMTQTSIETGASSSGLKLTVIDELEIKDLKPEAVQVAYLAGRQGLTLAESDVQSLRTYLAAGGFLLAEAVMGEPKFDAEFRAAAKTLGLELRSLDKEHPLVTGSMTGAVGYKLNQVRYRYALRADRIGKHEPELYGLYSGEKMVGVYSPFDLMYSQTGYDAWMCRGYEDEDALAILTNILLLASSR